MERPKKLGAIIEMSGSPRESVHEDFPPRLVTTSYQVEENNYESRKCLLKFFMPHLWSWGTRRSTRVADAVVSVIPLIIGLTIVGNFQRENEGA